MFTWKKYHILTLFRSEWGKLCGVLPVLSAIGLMRITVRDAFKMSECLLYQPHLTCTGLVSCPECSHNKAFKSLLLK